MGLCVEDVASCLQDTVTLSLHFHHLEDIVEDLVEDTVEDTVVKTLEIIMEDRWTH